MAGNRFIPDVIEDRLPGSKSKKEKQAKKRSETPKPRRSGKKPADNSLPGGDLLKGILGAQLSPIARYAKPVVKAVTRRVGEGLDSARDNLVEQLMVTKDRLGGRESYGSRSGPPISGKNSEWNKQQLAKDFRVGDDGELYLSDPAGNELHEDSPFWNPKSMGNRRGEEDDRHRKIRESLEKDPSTENVRRLYADVLRKMRQMGYRAEDDEGWDPTMRDRYRQIAESIPEYEEFLNALKAVRQERPKRDERYPPSYQPLY